jgi:predicted RNase H-like HicB family nuclease
VVAVKYEVEVTREGDAWLADVADLPGAHTYARNLEALDRNVREVIELVAHLEEGTSFDVHYAYQGVSQAFVDAAKVGEERAELEAVQRRLASASVRVAKELAREGWSVRDISGALKMTPGRVSQITSNKGGTQIIKVVKSHGVSTRQGG